MRTGTAVGLALLGLLWAGPVTARAADDGEERFLVPGTRAGAIVADRSFGLAGYLPSNSLNQGFGYGGEARVRPSGFTEARADAAIGLSKGTIAVSGYAIPRSEARARHVSEARRSSPVHGRRAARSQLRRR
jgi:hypothetical protein